MRKLSAWEILVPTGIALAVLFTFAAVRADEQLVVNPEFAAGADTPEGWSLSGATGRWIDRDVLEVVGTGGDSNYWRSADIRFTPGGLYRFAVRMRRPHGSGTAIVGPAFANRDFRHVDAQWQWFEYVFRVPDDVSASFLRLGQWHAQGVVQFDCVKLVPVRAIHTQADLPEGEGLLGEGESIDTQGYRFAPAFGYRGSNYHRPLLFATAGFNTNRWVFGPGDVVVYCFELPGIQFRNANVELNVNWYSRGACNVEISRDGKNWWQLATRQSVGAVQLTVPDDLLPAAKLFVRISANSNASFQVDRLQFFATLDRQVKPAIGQTIFATVQKQAQYLDVEKAVLTGRPYSGDEHLALSLRCLDEQQRPVLVELYRDQQDVPLAAAQVLLQPEGYVTAELPLTTGAAGEHRWWVIVRSGSDRLLVWEFSRAVPEFYRTDYGALLPSGDERVAVWWCESGWKVPRQRSLPKQTSPCVELWAAGNDFEAAQVVLFPREMIRGLKASVKWHSGAKFFGGDNTRVHWVYYHFVEHPTDYTGVRDWWPDALPPLEKPIDLRPGQNQPLWLLVHVPEGTPGGIYEATLRLEADRWRAEVPVRVHVWNFSLPRQNHLETAFGLGVSDIFRYHQLKSEKDKRLVLDLYFRCMSEHRISPYDPTPLDPIRVRFLPEADPPRAEVDFSAFDREMERVLSKFNFTTFRLPVLGMGGGSFHRRYPPQIAGYGEDTPQYRAMFSSYVQQLEEHLRQKGWLSKAFVYWFDEPAPKDYEFVTKGMERLRRYAPGLRRMLTEEPNEQLKAPVDIWCPVTYNYNHQEAEKRRAAGDTFWWYVCTGPKAPYCTLFIDHPATELRVWLWQTWQRKITGVLVWRINYWTSSAAFPDSFQNPYEDPMSYVSGYSTPRGVKRFWGNGDGRFIYPPLEAAVPGASGDAPVLKPPVPSIRLEMLREGIEDYELLCMLRELLQRHGKHLDQERLEELRLLLEVPESITKDMVTFTKDPRPIMQQRAKIAAAIEQLKSLEVAR